MLSSQMDSKLVHFSKPHALLSIIENDVTLHFVQGRISSSSDDPHIELFTVDGVATVDIAELQSTSLSIFFSCSSTANSSGLDLVWSRSGVVVNSTALVGADGTSQRRLNFTSISQLGVYTCTDTATNISVDLNITSANPAVCPVNDLVSVVEGLSAELAVYVSGYPPPQPSDIRWFRPNGTEISDEDDYNVIFTDSHNKLILKGVQFADGGLYGVEVEISSDGLIILEATTFINLYVQILEIGFTDNFYSVQEDMGTVELVVAVLNEVVPNTNVDMFIVTQDLRAEGGLDYTVENHSLTLNSSMLQQSMMINITDDSLYEGNEDFQVNITIVQSSQTVNLSLPQVMVSIIDDEAPLFCFSDNICQEQIRSQSFTPQTISEQLDSCCIGMAGMSQNINASGICSPCQVVSVGWDLTEVSIMEGNSTEFCYNLTMNNSSVELGEDHLEAFSVEIVSGSAGDIKDYRINLTSSELINGSTGRVCVKIHALNDSSYELNETLSLKIIPSANRDQIAIALTSDSMDITIIDINIVEVSISTTNLSVRESDSKVPFLIGVSNEVELERNLVILFRTENTSSEILDGGPYSIELSANVSNFTQCVSIVDNDEYEGDQQFAVEISLQSSVDNPRVRIFISRLYITILEDEPEYEVREVVPRQVITEGGINVTFFGPRIGLVANQPTLCVGQNKIACQIRNESTLTCDTPAFAGSVLPYILLLRENTTISSPEVALILGPRAFTLGSKRTVTYGILSNITIEGENFDSVSIDEFIVTVGDGNCKVVLINSTMLICTAPETQPNFATTAVIRIMVGNIDRELADMLEYVGVVPAEIIAPVVIIAVAALVVLFLIIIISRYLGHIRRKQNFKSTAAVMEMRGSEHWSRYKEVLSENTIISIQLEEVDRTLPNSLKISASHIKMSNTCLGQGEFGVVFKGVLMGWKDVPVQAVAVKKIKGFSPSVTSEIFKMDQFHHPHVMSLLGVCLDIEPCVSIVMPFMVNGSLLDYLKKERNNLDLTAESDIEQVLSVTKLMLKISHQIALGMAYLVDQKFIHRDLAARNCMVDSDGGIKVGDFGLAEDIYAAGYFREDIKSHVKLPFKWMAMESLNDFLFSEKTDVWSYGVTVWEIFNCGRTPYPGMDPPSLVRFVTQGERLDKPLNAACTDEIYQVMHQCWLLDPDDRPTFSELSSIVEDMLTSISGYMELGMVLESNNQSEDLAGLAVTDNKLPNIQGNIYSKAESATNITSV